MQGMLNSLLKRCVPGMKPASLGTGKGGQAERSFSEGFRGRHFIGQPGNCAHMQR